MQDKTHFLLEGTISEAYLPSFIIVYKGKNNNRNGEKCQRTIIDIVNT